MFIDTSAFVAVFCGEPEGAAFAQAIAAAKVRFTSPVVRLETCMVLSSRLDRRPTEVETDFDAFLAEAQIGVRGIDDGVGGLAVKAFETYGKGRGVGAKLNLADCLSYACAKAHHAPILFKGRDFAQTDLEVAPF